MCPCCRIERNDVMSCRCWGSFMCVLGFVSFKIVFFVCEHLKNYHVQMGSIVVMKLKTYL